MHEAAIADSILRQTSSILQRWKNEKRIDQDEIPIVEEIRVNIGAFRNVDPESLLFAFDSLRLDYPSMENSALSINIVPAQASCIDSAHEYEPDPENFFRCPRCNAGVGKMLEGEELDITGVDFSVAN